MEETLFRFLLTVRDNRPQASLALTAQPATLRELYSAPPAHLNEALGQCLKASLIEIDADVAALEKTNVPAPIFGLVLAVNNCLATIATEQEAEAQADAESQLNEFTEALVKSLPTARSFNTALAYHAVLRRASDALISISTKRATLLRAIIERSPLTALWSLDAHTPAALEPLASELLPGWQTKARAKAYGWRSDDEWLKTIIKLLGNEPLARWVRRRWLSMAETRPACRNTGLLLEALRRRGESRAFILDFYEAYDYFRARTRTEEWAARKRFWPLLEEIEKLLRVAGDNDAAMQVNRRGNEYFLKFRALIEIVIEENGIPTDYAHLSREFIQSLLPLLSFVTEGARQRLSFGSIAFSDAAS